METHLKINHLAPYSNYELLFLAKDGVWQLTTIEFKSKYPIWANSYWDEKKHNFFPEINKKDSRSGQGFNLKEIKPILRPLSDLTKDITNGNDIINFQQFFNQYDFEWLITSKNKMKLINSMDYFTVNKLFEWHFDVFNLRENDLCIYYNEL